MATHAPGAGRSSSHASLATTDSAISGSQRVSMEEFYYNRLLSVSLQQPVPSDSFEQSRYNVADTAHNIASTKTKIQPRADEGHEVLPPYTCSINTHAVFYRKMELESAIHKAQDRSWYRVWVELRGTALKIFTTKSTGMFSSAKSAPNINPDQPAWLLRGDEIRTYSLQHADVGMALDYHKRRYAIRVRVEAEQFLLSCIEMETFLHWLDSLSAAIDLAPPLDDRKLPVDLSLPRVRRRVQANRQSDVETNDNLLRQQRPGFVSEANSEEPSPGVASTYENRVQTTFLRPNMRYLGQQSFVNSPARTSSRSLSTPRATTPPSAQPRATYYLQSLNQSCLSTSSAPNPSVSLETGKWTPKQTWSPRYDMMYAKLCMKILLRSSPRETNLVIMRDKQWVVDWATGALRQCDPPSYGEIELIGSLESGE